MTNQERLDTQDVLAQFGVKSTEHSFDIVPAKGVGPIVFGMHKDDVARAFTYVYMSFFKDGAQSFRSDSCEQVGLIIHYDQDGFVCCIETMPARHASTKHILYGLDVQQATVGELESVLRREGKTIRRYDCGIEVDALGLSTFHSQSFSDESRIESLALRPPSDS